MTSTRKTELSDILFPVGLRHIYQPVDNSKDNAASLDFSPSKKIKNLSPDTTLQGCSRR